MKNRMHIVSCLVAMAGLASVAQAQVRISQVYGGGGATTGSPSFNADYVELFNAGTSPVTLTGHALQYSGATSTGNWTRFTLPDITIAANSYFLVQVSEPAANTVGPAITTTPDLRPSTMVPAPTQLFMNAITGRVALTDSTVLLVGAVATPAIVDLVGYGPTVTLSEGNSPAPAITNTQALFRVNNGCQDTNVNGSDFLTGTPAPRNSASPTSSCSGIVDCNNNGIADPVEIAGNPSLDCNNNTLLDSCEINSNNDCDGNGQLDSCQIAGNPLLDRNGNGRVDSCDIAQFPDLDTCNNNGIIDQFDTPAAGQDCNSNGIIDCWEIKLGQLTDVDANGVSDVCEGAIVVEAPVSAYLQGAAGTPPRDGIVNETNGSAFFTIQNPASSSTFFGYGVVRFNNSSFSSTNASRIYLSLTQRNAAFSRPQFVLPGDPNNVEVFYSNTQDSTVIVPGTTATPNNNLTVAGFDSNTLFADRALAGSYLFGQGSNPPPAIPDGGTSNGNGTRDSIKLYDASQTNLPGGESIRAEVASGTGELTLVVNAAPSVTGAVAATYAGTNSIYRGPSLVIFPGGSTLPDCGSIDFNGDGLFPDDSDLIDFLNVLAGGPCSTEPLFTCGSIDFNGDGLFPDDNDLVDFLVVLAGGQPANCNP
jgi:hypothetical protein